LKALWPNVTVEQENPLGLRPLVQTKAPCPVGAILVDDDLHPQPLGQEQHIEAISHDLSALEDRATELVQFGGNLS
jgi:hypothetical protein